MTIEMEKRTSEKFLYNKMKIFTEMNVYLLFLLFANNTKWADRVYIRSVSVRSPWLDFITLSTSLIVPKGHQIYSFSKHSLVLEKHFLVLTK